MSENKGNSTSLSDAIGKTVGSIIAISIITAWITIVASWTLEFIRG
jgi:hypothetical protein